MPELNFVRTSVLNLAYEQSGPPAALPVVLLHGYPYDARAFDAVVPLVNAEFLAERLPDSRMVVIDAGHFVWEEEPTKYASAVLDSITGSWP